MLGVTSVVDTAHFLSDLMRNALKDMQREVAQVPPFAVGSFSFASSSQVLGWKAFTTMPGKVLSHQ